MMQQGTPEWYRARAGKVTASRIADIMARTKTGVSASRKTYMGQLIAERLTGEPMESKPTAAMQWGTETEPQARTFYEFMRSTTVTEIGFVEHPEIEMAGASPDGLVGKDGLIEIKCPNTATHIDMLLSGKVPAKYLKQMQWQMACTGSQWCDFMSFDPRLPVNMQALIICVLRDEEMIADMEKTVKAFLAEMEDKIGQLTIERAREAA
jgi:putative phage-type endonuclease